MKKVLALLMAFLMISPAMAETITLSAGIWLIGKDIPAGYYTTSGDDLLSIGMYDVLTEDGKADWKESSALSQSIFINSECVLLDGYYLLIEDGNATFSPIKPTEQQLQNDTYTDLLNNRQQYILGNYGVFNLVHYLHEGSYTVGVDIPAGSWCIESDILSEPTTVTIQDGSKVEKYQLVSPLFTPYQPGDLTAVYLPLREGMVVTISQSGDGHVNPSVLISPFARPLTDW